MVNLVLTLCAVLCKLPNLCVTVPKKALEVAKRESGLGLDLSKRGLMMLEELDARIEFEGGMI